jgi:transcriptional regulator with XRE-family HTH domain
MDKCTVDYGNFIKERRLKMGLTQEDVSKRLGISQVAYGRYELGIREPKFSLIMKISEVLDFKPGEFFDNYRG